jgi:4-hydroxybenzoate polyprenyltransferase
MSAPLSEDNSAARPTLAGHLQIARIDHWVKNVFVLPGIVVALWIAPEKLSWELAQTVLLGFAAVCLIASSNYVINELLDARFDRLHPVKKARPVPSGRVSIPGAYAEWLLLMAVGLGTAALVSRPFAVVMAVLWLMGCVYNIRPLRTKEIAYLDVLSESVNNPLRMLAGWYMVIPSGLGTVPPASLLLSYWMAGCYFMAMKRFAEYREIGDPVLAAGYRRSFAYYDERKLLVSIMFYASAAMLFLGVFIMRYRLELVLSFPLIALVMAVYLSLAFRPDSAVQAPEKLYREPALMASVVACAIAMTVLSFVEIPVLHRLLSPTIPGAAVKHGAPP